MKKRLYCVGKGVSTIALAACLSSFSGLAIAQDIGDTAASESATSNSAADVITVTARRREENAQSVPVAVSVFGPDELERKAVDSLDDLTRVTPGLRYAAEGGASNTIISLRGLSKIPIGDGTPAVVAYFSEVPLAAVGTNLPTFDLASVQVLKGSQGTLFGRNTIGGAVLLTPAAPTDEFSGYISATAGNLDTLEIEGAVNLPLSDFLSVRIAGQHRKADGFVKNIGVGPDLGDIDQYALRGSVLFEPFSNFRNTFIFDYFEANESSGPIVPFATNGAPSDLSPLFGIFDPDFAAQFASQEARGLRVVNLDSPGQRMDRELWGITNRTEFDIAPNVTVTNIFGYRNTSVLNHSDVDGFPTLNAGPFALDATALMIPGFAPGDAFLDQLVMFNAGQVSNSKQITEELQLSGTSFDNQLDWIIGGFYSKESPNGANGSFVQQFDPILSVVAGPLAGEEIHLNPPQTMVNLTTSESKAIYGQIGLDLSNWALDGLTLNLGARYTWDEVSVCGGNFLAGSIGGIGGAFTTTDASFVSNDECQTLGAVSVGDGIGSNSTESDAPTWTVGLDYQASDNLFLYVTSRRGYRQAGVNTPVFETPCTTGVMPGGCAPPPATELGVDLTGFQFIGSEQVTDVEIGVKSNWELGGMPGLFNVAAFNMKYKDAVQFINVSGLVPSGDPAFPSRGAFGLNAADLSIRGVELEAMINPAEILTLSASAAYIDQNVDNVATLPAGFIPLSEASVTLPTPKWSTNAAFRLELPINPSNGELSLSGDYFWTDDWQAQGSPMQGYDVANFRLDWDQVGGLPLTASLFVNNAFDEEYIVSPTVVLTNFPFNTGILGRQRTFGGKLTYRFGN